MGETAFSKVVEKRVLTLTGGRCKSLRMNAGGYRGRAHGHKAGTPDRLFLLPGGIALFIELKDPNARKYDKEPTSVQRAWHEEVRALGFEVHVVTELEQVDPIVLRLLGRAA